MASWEEPIETGEVPASGSTFDAIIVGGGPGGCSAAGYLAMANKKVLLIEKGVWPRDKICGDAVGGKSLSHVKALHVGGVALQLVDEEVGIIVEIGLVEAEAHLAA